MLKKSLLYVFCSCLLAFNACNKDEEEISTPSYRDQNWFVIPDKPGELNQLVYKIYNETGIPIFVNDTLGEEYYAKDAQGNLLVRVETFNLLYEIFGEAPSPNFQPTRHAVFSTDTAAMLLAVQMIRDKVIPYLPKEGEYRPKSYLLVDSINDLKTVMDWSTWDDVVLTYTSSTYSAQKGVVVGLLGDLKKMIEADDKEGIDWWCARIIASKVVKWMLAGNVDLTEWYDITYENWVSYEEARFAYDVEDYEENVKESAGMLSYCVDNPEVRVLVSEEQDLLDYVALVYIYRGREQEFYANPDYNYDRVHRKFEGIQEFVAAFESLNPMPRK
ncbi:MULTISPECIES: hypothetical protein [Butyricimonas]|uniref:hypothetical protein n=1 Tax=Butyricimonas TaxID=574697 RepID=UPI0007FB5141|nr:MULTISPECIES: hypothetical protein [Butyricimonas]